MCRSDELKSEELYRNYIEEDNNLKWKFLLKKNCSIVHFHPLDAF